jgi:mRNA-degrading endonuclease RelE of RelBE toxin-antitoxin system
MPYRIEFTAEARAHVRVLAARQQAMLRDAINAQLVHEPTIATRNRKPLRENDVAPWELRVGELRVFYDVVEQADHQIVVIQAVGIKRGSRLRIGGEERTL